LSGQTLRELPEVQAHFRLPIVALIERDSRSDPCTQATSWIVLSRCSLRWRD
jgi:hypothetical protein